MISKRLIHKYVENTLDEMEDAVLASTDQDLSTQQTDGPIDMTGIKSAAAQACTSIGELIKQCSAVGMDTEELEDIVDEINDMYGLPGDTVSVGNSDEGPESEDITDDVQG